MIGLYKRIISITLLGSMTLLGADYSTMSTEALMDLRGKVPVEKIEAFGNELSHRVQTMNEKDLKKYGIWEMIKDQSGKEGVSCDCSSIKKRPLRIK